MARVALMTPERIARRKKIKKWTGHESDHVSCLGCHREFSDDEVDRDEPLYVLGRFGNVVYCKECFRKLFLRGGLIALNGGQEGMQCYIKLVEALRCKNGNP